MAINRYSLRSLHSGDPSGKDPFNGLANNDYDIVEQTNNHLKVKFHNDAVDSQGNFDVDIKINRDGSYDMIVRKSDGSILAECNSAKGSPDADGFKIFGDNLLNENHIKHKKPKLHGNDMLAPSEDGSIVASNKSLHQHYRPT